jgi:pimeloyl-ACP methyl ester carboxylesterase
MPYATSTDATALHYLDWGDGPTILFTHGWAASAAMWEYQMLPLSAAGFRCIGLDRRGCGKSEDPGRGYRADTFAADLAGFLDQLDLFDVTLVAHSMGAGEAARYLAAHGDHRVARLVLVAPVTPCAVRRPDNPFGVPAELLEGLIADILRDRPSYVTDLAGPFFGSHIGLEVPDALVQWGIRMVLEASALASVEMMRTFFFTDFRPDVAAVQVPTLIVHGDSDAGAPVELFAIPTHELIPGSKLKIYERGPHGLPLTHPDQLTADILAVAKS